MGLMNTLLEGSIMRCGHTVLFRVFYPGEQQILVRENEEGNKGQGGPHASLL